MQRRFPKVQFMTPRNHIYALLIDRLPVTRIAETTGYSVPYVALVAEEIQEDRRLLMIESVSRRRELLQEGLRCA